MQVIADRADYYDFAGGGHDGSVLYDRRQQSAIFLDRDAGLPESFTFDFWLFQGTMRLVPFFAMIGGFGVPGVSIVISGQSGKEETRHYDDEALVNAAHETFETIFPKSDRFAQRELREGLKKMTGHLDRGRQDLSDLCVETGIVTGEIYHQHGRPHFFPTLLRDMGLETVVPAHEAHMMVARFVGGVMPEKLAEGEPVPDAVKIVKAGFDTKTSFRKTKGCAR